MWYVTHSLGVVCCCTWIARYNIQPCSYDYVMTSQTWLEVRDGIAESYVFTRVYGFYQYTYNLQLYTPSTERTFVSPFERNQREMISWLHVYIWARYYCTVYWSLDHICASFARRQTKKIRHSCQNTLPGCDGSNPVRRKDLVHTADRICCDHDALIIAAVSGMTKHKHHDQKCYWYRFP